ncbi:zinc finger protein, partial [Clarias magur]
MSSSLPHHLSHRGQSSNPFPLDSHAKRSHYGTKLNPYTRARMAEAWQQHAVAPPPVVHTIPPGAESALGCAVYGIVLQPETLQSQQQQHHSQQHSQQQQHPSQAQQPTLQVGSEGGHKCGACGHDISHLANPHEHQCMVSQDRSFQCTQCLKIFHQATDLLEHQCVQVEQKPFVCGV